MPPAPGSWLPRRAARFVASRRAVHRFRRAKIVVPRFITTPYHPAEVPKLRARGLSLLPPEPSAEQQTCNGRPPALRCPQSTPLPRPVRFGRVVAKTAVFRTGQRLSDARRLTAIAGALTRTTESAGPPPCAADTPPKAMLSVVRHAVRRPPGGGAGRDARLPSRMLMACGLTR